MLYTSSENRVRLNKQIWEFVLSSLAKTAIHPCSVSLEVIPRNLAQEKNALWASIVTLPLVVVAPRNLFYNEKNGHEDRQTHQDPHSSARISIISVSFERSLLQLLRLNRLLTQLARR